MKAILVILSLLAMIVIWTNRVSILMGNKKKNIFGKNYKKKEIFIIGIIDFFLFVLFMKMFGKTAIGLQVTAGMNVATSIFLMPILKITKMIK